MPNVAVPHFDLPFRMDYRPGYDAICAVVVEQDSVDEIAACAEASMRVRLGEFSWRPTFGSPDLTFEQEPVDTDAMIAAIVKDEPRAKVAFAAVYDDLVANVEARITRGGGILG